MPQRLLFFTDSEGVGGSEKYLVDLMLAMMDKGYDVSLLCHHQLSVVDYVRQRTSGRCRITAMDFPSVTRSRIFQTGLALNRSWKNLFSFLKVPGQLICYFHMVRSFRKIRRFLKNDLPDILHVVSGGYPAAESLRAAVLAADSCRVPHRILTFHNQAMPLLQGFSFIERGIDRKVEAALDGIIAASESSRRLLISRRGFKPEHISLIYNGIIPGEYEGHSKSNLRRELNISPEMKLIGTIGFLQMRKGHVYLIEAFKEISFQFPKTHLLIIGDGPLADTLKDKITELGLAGRVSMPGYLPNATRFLSAMDIFVFPSTGRECLPYVVLYGMDAALPIVATKVGGVGEQIEEGVSGRLVPPCDSSALAGAMRGMLQDEISAVRMGLAARKQVREFFSQDRMIQETHQLYVGAYEKNQRQA